MPGAPDRPRLSLLDPERDRGLLADLRRYAEVAGVDPGHVELGMDRFGCTSAEVAWAGRLLRARRGGRRQPAGLKYVERAGDVDARMRGLAGTLVRNYVDARVVDLERVLGDDRPQCSVLLVPQCLDGLPAWRLDALAGALQGPLGRGRSVALWVAAPPTAAKLGTALHAVLRRLEPAS